MQNQSIQLNTNTNSIFITNEQGDKIAEINCYPQITADGFLKYDFVLQGTTYTLVDTSEGKTSVVKNTVQAVTFPIHFTKGL